MTDDSKPAFAKDENYKNMIKIIDLYQILTSVITAMGVFPVAIATLCSMR